MGNVIVEAPQSQSGEIHPLADFDQVIFTDAQVDIKGTLGKINNPSWRNYEIDMAYSGGLKADASPLSSDGDSFTVDWVHR